MFTISASIFRVLEASPKGLISSVYHKCNFSDMKMHDYFGVLTDKKKNIVAKFCTVVIILERQKISI